MIKTLILEKDFILFTKNINSFFIYKIILIIIYLYYDINVKLKTDDNYYNIKVKIIITFLIIYYFHILTLIYKKIIFYNIIIK